MIADSFGAEQYGAASGRIAMFAHVTRAAGPVTVGLVKASASSYSFAFLGLALLSAGAGILWTARGARLADSTSGRR